MSEARCIAHPNVALSKYWGKRAGEGNFPAVPSLSVTLAALATRTHVRFDASLPDDRLTIDGENPAPETRARASLFSGKGSSFGP